MALTIIIVVLIAVFVPAWFNRNQSLEADRAANRALVTSIRQQSRANVQRSAAARQPGKSALPLGRGIGRAGEPAPAAAPAAAATAAALAGSDAERLMNRRIFRLRSLRRVLIVVLAIAMASIVTAVALIAVADTWLTGALVGFGVTVVAAWALRMVSDRLLVAQELARRNRRLVQARSHFLAEVAKPRVGPASPVVEDDRRWTAPAMPDPRRKVGQLINPEFAEVVELAAHRPAPAPALDLDSILARRRG